jgi:DNA (cytosine-5)-methyltransferase 1
MRYGSVCSGVEAASMAWEPLGWQPVFFSEIEEFPSEVLKTHWPEVPNHGDMEKFDEWGYQRGSIDVLVGGTPCQSFSIAGLRGGISDARGNLALTYCRMVDKLRPRWTVWENVPGVLSSGGGRDFGSIIGALAELGYSVSWRVLDAQNFGVPQRRRRVFLVGCSSGDWRDPAQVLFEQSCGTGNFEKSGEKKQDDTAQVERSVARMRGFGDYEIDGTCSTCKARDWKDVTDIVIDRPVADTLQTTSGDWGRTDSLNYVAYEYHPQDSRVKEMGDVCQTVAARWGTGGCNTPIVYESHPIDSRVKELDQVSSTVTVKWAKGTADTPLCVHGTQDPIVSDKAMPIQRNAGQENALLLGSKVRRLTPVEAERLQGFPDGHSDIGWKGKPTPDSHRYKAMGNSMAVPVMRWIGERIQGVDHGSALHRNLA